MCDLVALAAVLAIGAILYLAYRTYKKRLAAAVDQWGARVDPTCDDPTTDPYACSRLLRPMNSPPVSDRLSIAEYSARAVGRFIAYLGSGDTRYLHISQMRGPYLAMESSDRGAKYMTAMSPARTQLPLAASWLSDDGRTVLVAIRGTKTAADFMTDMKYHETVPNRTRSVTLRAAAAPSHELQVHSGMYAAYLSIREALFASLDMRTTRALISGHSMGAAVAYYFAHELAVERPWVTVEVIGFAPPRAGNAAFATAVAVVADTATYINMADFVPSVPWSFMPDMTPPYTPDEFAHVVPIYSFNSRKRDVTACHSLLTYYNCLVSSTPPVLVPQL